MKIDRSFIAELPGDDDACGLVEAVQTMARTLELWTVAEGIETEEQLRFLKRIGCEFGQGYLFSAAVPAAEMEPLLAVADAAGIARRSMRIS